ncbi:MAG TPA: cyclic nucleotide-binding domain-containing protein, partial [Verrucomicrobiae bacterium]
MNRTELQALRFIAQERQFAAGQEIFHEGAAGDGVYFVKSGLVEIYNGNGNRHIFSRLGPGEIFGEMAVIEHRPRSASAAAAEPTQVYFLPRGELLTFIERSPGLALALLQQISHRLRTFNQLHVRELVQAESLAVIGRFAQGIVHDLKNPLSIISLSAETFSMPTVSPELRAKAQARIRKQVERVSDMVSDILIFTQGARKDAD